MAYTTINKGSDYFNTKLYTGNGSTNHAITGVGFQPDLVWLKARSNVNDHKIFDVVRGVPEFLSSNLTNAETTTTNFSSIDSDGFTVTTNSTPYNASGETYASWNWLAGGTAVSNTQGSITSSVSANQIAGFSIVSYTGTGVAGSIGHGLGSTPKMIIKKKRSGADAWNVWHTSIGDGSKALFLNLTNAVDTNANYASNVPTSSLFYVGTDSMINASSATYIAYCFAEKKGYSKFGTYTGNADNDGPFIYCGFSPALIITKRTDTLGDWFIYDNKRPSYNVVNQTLNPNTSDAEESTRVIDLLSNGFKQRAGYNDTNAAGGSYIYMAFAENPFTTSTGIPTTARW